MTRRVLLIYRSLGIVFKYAYILLLYTILSCVHVHLYTMLN